VLKIETTFRDVKKAGDGWVAKCPGHDDSKSSLSIGRGDGGKILLKCFAGCDLDRILAAARLTPADLFPEKTPTTKATVTATYKYCDEGGLHLYDVCRFNPKDFRQRRADGVWKMHGVRRVLYRLPELQGQSIAYVVEGEKDADRLTALGMPATCNVGGAGKWKSEYTAQLKAATVENVVVLADNDEPGRQHAADVARSCHDAGLKVKILVLPDVPPKGDVSDWLDAGYAKANLVSLVRATALYEPPTTTAAPSPLNGGPSPEPADVAQLLTSLITFIRRFVVVTDHQVVAIAMWIAHTHAVAAFDCTPYLQITSATKRAGKTRLLEVLEPLVARPWLTGRTSAAALVRKVDAESPSLLLDESDAAFGGEKDYAEALRGILNSGYRRSGKATVCIGPSTKIEAKDFSTFSPKAIAGIGKLPDTVADRSIAIELRRKHTDEPCERWRERDGHAQATPIREHLAAWAVGARDRQADVWEPLLAIADLAGGEWPDRARRAAIGLAGAVEDQDINVELLHDINTVFTDIGTTFITSKQLVEKLVEMEDRPWADWRQGKPISTRAVADRLKTFHVFPKPNAAGSARGYDKDRFLDAWSRYPAIKPSNRQNPTDSGDESLISNRQGTPTPDTSKTQETPINTGLSDALTLQSGETGTEAMGGTDRAGRIQAHLRTTDGPPQRRPGEVVRV